MTTASKPYAELMNVTVEQYHCTTGRFGSSEIKRFINNPLGFRKKHVEDFDEDRPRSWAMDLGAAADLAILTPEAYRDAVAVMPKLLGGGHQRKTDTTTSEEGKENKAIISEFREQNVGKLILTPEDDLLICDMVEAVQVNKAACDLLEANKQRQAAIYFDPCPIVPCKALFDFYGGGDEGGDLKTSRAVNQGAFLKDAKSYGYNYQAAHYANAHELLTGMPMTNWYWIVVQNQPIDGVIQCWVQEMGEDRLAAYKDKLWRVYARIQDAFENDDFYPPNFGQVIKAKPMSDYELEMIG